MGFERERRLASAAEQHALDGESSPQRAVEHPAAGPGKRTLVEQWLAQVPEPASAGAWTVPAAPAASQRGPAKTELDALRARGLEEVCAALTAMRGAPGLLAATRAAASKATRPPRPWPYARPGPPDPIGQAMWRVVERRAATLFRQAAEAGEVEPGDPAVEAALARAGDGQPLPLALRREMERALGGSFERVRVHTDSVATDAARVLRARAFTVGEDIFFAAGAYEPEAQAGRKLLAHELAHVVQAHQGRTGPGGAGLRISAPDESLEREADAAAEGLDGERAASEPASGATSGAAAETATGRATAPAALRAPAVAPGPVMRKAAAPGLDFDGPSTPVGKLGRVQAPNGVHLRVRPDPNAPHPASPIPFNGLVYVESRTTQAHASERWCRVIATEAGAAGFCEERFLAIDPPSPRPGYGAPSAVSDSR